MSIVDTVKMDLIPDEVSWVIINLALSHYIYSISNILESDEDLDKEEIELLEFTRNKSIELESEIRNHLNWESYEKGESEI